MIVACPNCNAKFRAADDGSDTAGPLKCAKCGLVFTAQTPGPPGSVPPPVSFDTPGAAAPQRTLSDPLGKEWDAKMSDGSIPQAAPTAALSTPPAPAPPAAADATAHPGALPPGFDPLAEVLPAATAPAAPTATASAPPLAAPGAAAGSFGPIAKRDPFYEENPLVVERPPADALNQSPRVVSTVPTAAPAATPDPFAAAKAQAGTTDPFGQSASAAALPQSSAPTTPPAAAPPAAPAERSAAESTDPFANVSLSAPAGAPLAGEGGSFAAPPESESALDSEMPLEIDSRPVRPAANPNVPLPPVMDPSARRGSPNESFPPPARPAPVETVAAHPSNLLWGLVTALASALLVTCGLFALWQFELIDIDPEFTNAVSSRLGTRSPLNPPEGDLRQRSQAAADLAAEAEENQAFGVAVVHYRRALELEPDADDMRDALIRCYGQLGDQAAVKDLRGH